VCAGIPPHHQATNWPRKAEFVREGAFREGQLAAF